MDLITLHCVSCLANSLQHYTRSIFPSGFKFVGVFYQTQWQWLKYPEKYSWRVHKMSRYYVLPFSTVTSSMCRMSSLEKPRKLTNAYENGPSLYCICKHWTFINKHAWKQQRTCWNSRLVANRLCTSTSTSTRNLDTSTSVRNKYWWQNTTLCPEKSNPLCTFL